MKLLSRATVGLIVTMTAAVLGPVQPAVSAPAVAHLRGTTVITGDSSAVMRVRLARPATLDLAPVVARNGRLRPAGVRIPGGGELFPGFVLTRRSGRSASVMAFRAPHAMRERDDVTTIGAYGEVAGRACTQCKLPAGDYDLYLVAALEPARVILKFDGLTGRSRLTPTAGVAARAFQAPSTNADRSAISPLGGGRERPGWVVGSYNVDVQAGIVPVAMVDARVCLEGGREPQCREASLTGERDSIGGMQFAVHRLGDGRLEHAVEWEPRPPSNPDVMVDHAFLWVPSR